MGLSTNTYTYSGGSKQFSATFADGYIEQSHVTVYVVGAVDGLGDQVYLNFTWTSESQITVTDALNVGDEVTVERTVPKDNVLVDLDENGAITREGLARNNRQALHAVHEVIDGRLENSLITAVNDLVARVNEIDASVAAAAGSASTASAAAAAALASANEAAAVANSAATILRNLTITSTGVATYALQHDLPLALVFIDGVQQNTSAYSHDQAGREITFAEAVPTGAEIEVLYSAGTAAYSLRTFEDEESFAKNTELSYTNIPVGATVKVRKEGSVWEVLASDASDEDLTINGVKYKFARTFDYHSNKHQVNTVFAVIRQTAEDAGWGAIINGTHEPGHLQSVAVVGNVIRVTYDFDADRVGTFSVTPDETFLSWGVFAGASVGTNIADISAYSSISGVIKAGTNGIQANIPNGTLVSQVVDQAAGTITVTHLVQSHSKTEGTAVLTSRGGGSQYGEFAVAAQSKTGFTLQYMRPVALYVEYDGTDWTFTGATAAGFSGVWSGNYLQITTPTNGVTDPVYTVGRTLETSRRDHPVTKNTGSSSLRVYFLDKDNNIEAAPQTGMMFTLNSSMLVPAAIPDGFGVLGAVERHNVPCDVNKLYGSNGNFWISATHIEAVRS